MRVTKRNGREVNFDISKIENAIRKANNEVPVEKRLSEVQIQAIATNVAKQCEGLGRSVAVDEIQDMVEIAIMEMRGYEVAQAYVRYRFKRDLARKTNTTDGEILELVERSNEDAMQENANKNPVINSTQRDYIAGLVSKDITQRILLPDDVVKAHKDGAIHFHDADYFISHEHNCELVNLEDMLQNGTVISGTQIVKPHSFGTACNIATQIIAQVASNQYGGQSISLAHLAPFVDVSRQRIRKNLNEELEKTGVQMDDEAKEKIVSMRLHREVVAGVQTINYQIVTLLTTNGQTPFVTLFMYLDEVPEGQTRDDMAMVIEEVLRQRIKGLPDETGAWITPAFPKLVYVLDEDNIHEDSRYWYLTELAARCTAKRMVPDYVSAKIMKELKGDVYAPMGCRSFLTPDKEGLNPDGSHKYYGRLTAKVEPTLNGVNVRQNGVESFPLTVELPRGQYRAKLFQQD